MSDYGPLFEEGVKDLRDKVQVDLIPYPALKAIARVRSYGNQKYGHPFKWYNAGIGHKEFVAASIRHLYKHLDAINYENRSVIDEESGLLHIEHALCSLALAVTLWEKEGSNESGE